MAKTQKQEVAIVVPPKKELVLEGDPQAQLDFAMKAANALMAAVSQKPKKVMIRGEQYLEYGDWQTLARFFGATASVAWSKKLVDDKGTFLGYEARAEVLHNGTMISSAEAMCMKAEKNWNARDEFMLRSMAQTRAAAKALRNAYGWVAELAGMRSTPAEEMGEVYDTSPISEKAIPTVTYDDVEDTIKAKTAMPRPIVTDTPKPRHTPSNPVDKYLVQKKQIKDLADKICLVKLEGEEYKVWIEEQTGLDLTQPNYPEIITRLEALA